MLHQSFVFVYVKVASSNIGLVAVISDPVKDGVSPQKVFIEAAQCSYVNPVALRALGSASLVWLAWLSLQGVMIGCKPHWHPEQTTAGCVCVCVCVCVLNLQSMLNTCRSLERSTGGLNLSESGVVDLSEHTLTHWWVHTKFLAPLSSMLGTASTLRAH